jgi:hypothetical protein
LAPAPFVASPLRKKIVDSWSTATISPSMLEMDSANTVAP